LSRSSYGTIITEFLLLGIDVAVDLICLCYLGEIVYPGFENPVFRYKTVVIIIQNKLKMPSKAYKS
jgi:hypothetical protein